MALIDITRDAVLQAIAHYEDLGREEFLSDYGFGPARSFFLRFDQKEYDSKAIMGYAHGLHPGPRWAAEDFSGGEATVARQLRKLGFEVINRRNADWTRDEVILACDLVWTNKWNALPSEDSRVQELSTLLRRYWIHPVENREQNFRNSNGVARKTADIATRHPDYPGVPTRGGKTDREVLLEFMIEPQLMHDQAVALRAAIEAGDGADEDTTEDLLDIDLEGFSALEGGLLERLHLRRERKPGLRNKAVAAYKKVHGTVACEACGFNFADAYGPRGEDYIECHHRLPLSQSGPVTTRISDLVLLCSNCHRIIHRSRPWISVDQLVELVSIHRKVP